MNAVRDEILAELHAIHHHHPDLQAFCAFPDDVQPQPVLALVLWRNGFYTPPVLTN